MNDLKRRTIAAMGTLLWSLAATAATPYAPDAQTNPPLSGAPAVESDVVLRAMTAELDRSMKDLVLEGLERPYFIQYAVDDTSSVTLTAEFGGLTSAQNARRRTLSTDVRVGSYELDDGNLGFGGGGGGTLPLDDNEAAIRHAIWLATDSDYKMSLELLARKRAMLKDMRVEDRPDDFSKAPVVSVVDPIVRLTVDVDAWSASMRDLSARFLKHPDIEDSGVTFFAGHSNRYLVNSDGTRYRHGDTGIMIMVNASVRAADGMELSDNLQYVAEQFDQLPLLDAMKADVDKLCDALSARAACGQIEHYVGPVLFDAPAAAVVVHELLADALCAKPVTLGARWNQDDSMEKKLGLRILPRGVNVYDDPNEHFFEGKILAGHNTYDDEAVVAQRVSLVEHGILKNLLSCRTPSRKVKESNGHGQGRFGAVSPHVGCMFVEATDGLGEEELKSELLQAARDEGLEFAIRVASLGSGSGAGISDPVAVYKVAVGDGSETQVRGLELLPFEVAKMKDILAVGKSRAVYNDLGGGAGTGSVIAPAMVFKELELTKSEPQYDLLPILKSPARREEKSN